MRALLLVLAISGCGADPAPMAMQAVSLEVPAHLRDCPTDPAPVPVPPLPRTFDSIVGFGRKADARAQEAVKSLDQCRAKHEALIKWIETTAAR